MFKRLKRFFFGDPFTPTDFNLSPFGDLGYPTPDAYADNAHLRKQEEAKIKPYANMVHRQGEQLYLTLQQGAPKCLHNNDIAEFEHVRYFFSGMLPNQPIAVVHSLHYEWNELHFISLVDGSELYQKENAKDAFASPDGRYMLVTQADEMYEISVEIFPVDLIQPWARSFKANALALKKLAPLKARWVNPEEVLVLLAPMDMLIPEGEMRVKLDGGKWQSTVRTK